MSNAEILDGKKLAAEIREEIADEIKKLTSSGHEPPGLAVILVGHNPASQSYVKSKTKACETAGLYSRQIDLPEDVSQEDLIQEVQKQNNDPKIHGILVQLPLPKHIDEQIIIKTIDPDKDVDGFHPVNAGRLSIGLPGFVPCTPWGIRELIIRSGIETSGKHAVVLGRSNIVGKPMAMLLSRKGPGGDATVTIAHSRTQNLKEVCRQADILVAAIGRAEFVTSDMIKEGATVIDVGINRVDDSSRERGYRLVGDVDFEAASRVAGAITPVPGGVGPLTIAMLLSNTLQSCKNSQNIKSS